MERMIQTVKARLAECGVPSVVAVRWTDPAEVVVAPVNGETETIDRTREIGPHVLVYPGDDVATVVRALHRCALAGVNYGKA